MKDFRLRFADEEYGELKSDADRLQISVRQLVHDRAIKGDSPDPPLHGVQILTNEVAQARESMNQIIRRETNAELRLYEDDVIRMERVMTNLEENVCVLIKEILRQVKKNGHT